MCDFLYFLTIKIEQTANDRFIVKGDGFDRWCMEEYLFASRLSFHITIIT